jgi:hypothetical protein
MRKARKFLATIRKPSTGESVFVVAVNWGDNVIPFDENIELVSLEYYEKLKQHLAERDALILELEKVREFYGDRANYTDLFDYKGMHNFERIGNNPLQDQGDKARTPLKNQKLLDEIKEGKNG